MLCVPFVPFPFGDPTTPFPVPWGFSWLFPQYLWRWGEQLLGNAEIPSVGAAGLEQLLSPGVPKGWICPLAVQGHVLAPRLAWDRDCPGKALPPPLPLSHPFIAGFLFFPLPGKNPKSSALKTSGIFAAVEQGWDFHPNPKHLPDFWVLYL